MTPDEIRSAIISLGPPKKGQVLFIDGRISGDPMDVLNEWPDEWAGTEVKFIVPPHGCTLADCIILGEPQK